MVNKGEKSIYNRTSSNDVSRMAGGIFFCNLLIKINMEASSTRHTIFFYFFDLVSLSQVTQEERFSSLCPLSPVETSDLMRLKCNMQFASTASYCTDGYDGTCDIPGPLRELSTSRQRIGGGRKCGERDGG